MEDGRSTVHNRRSVRLESWDYSWPWWYFATVVVKNRRCLFGEIIDDKMHLNETGKIIEEEWLKTPSIRPNVELDAYVIMPNHLHGIIIIGEAVGATRRVAQKKPIRATLQVAPTQTLVSGSLGAIIGQFKSKAAKRINALQGTQGIHLWQRNYHDHIIRDEGDLHRTRTYIVNNPLQWALDDENPDNVNPKLHV